MISHDRRGPVAESIPRESSASLYILVQIQAGPPAFAAPQLRLSKPAKPEASGPAAP